MKINYTWKKSYSSEEIGVILNPLNEHLKANLEKNLLDSPMLEVFNSSNNRKTSISCLSVFSIEAMGHLSIVRTVDNKTFYVKGRLKEFEYLEEFYIRRISNSVLLNLSQIESFNATKYACLEVQTKLGETYIVSRHYAKQIKEKLK